MITVPRLPKGKGYLGPEFYGCCNTGLAPAIFHLRTGRYVIGQEIPCREAMRSAAAMLGNKRTWRDPHGRQVWLFKTRKPAVAKFLALCESRKKENDAMRQEHAETARKAARGDLAAALHLGDF